MILLLYWIGRHITDGQAKNMKKLKPVKIKNGETTIMFNTPMFIAWKELADSLHNTAVAVGAGDINVVEIKDPRLRKVAEYCVDFENVFAYLGMLGSGCSVSFKNGKKNNGSRK